MKMIFIIIQMKNILKKKKGELNTKKINQNYFHGMVFGAINIYF